MNENHKINNKTALAAFNDCSPETFIHEILNGARRRYPHAFFVEDCRPIDASVFRLQHLDEVTDVVRHWPEDKLALFVSTRQWTDDVRQTSDVVNGDICKKKKAGRLVSITQLD
jgi:hypothetical protein